MGMSDDCMLYGATLDRDGYAVREVEGKYCRVTHLIMNPPKGMVVDHLCRTPPCINPDHLEVVTNAENVRRGNSAKLNYNLVDKIKNLYATGVWKQHEIARQFGIDQAQVSRIVTNKAWSK